MASAVAARYSEHGTNVKADELSDENLLEKFLNGEEIMLEDDPSTFARTVIGLLSTPDRRALLGRAARRRVEEDYSFRSLCQALCSAMTEVRQNATIDHMPVNSR